MDEFIDGFKRGLDNNHNIVLFCNCSVSYDGRAQSFLPKGDRIIMIKKDKTLLVHQPEGNTPINYMKDGSEHKLISQEGSYVLESKNAKEYLRIIINDIYHLHSRNLEDGNKLLIKGTERDMAEMIMSNPELIDKNFKPLTTEEHTKFGFIDVMGHRDGALVVIECKRYTADLKAVSQLRRYVEKIMASRGIEEVKGILASPAISPNAMRMLESWGFEYRKVNPPRYLEKYSRKQRSLECYS